MVWSVIKATEKSKFRSHWWQISYLQLNYCHAANTKQLLALAEKRLNYDVTTKQLEIPLHDKPCLNMPLFKWES